MSELPTFRIRLLSAAQAVGAVLVVANAVLSSSAGDAGANTAAPSHEFDDRMLDEAIPIHGSQMFIDDHIIEKLDGARKVLNQPKKHPQNPLVVRDKPWEGYAIAHGSVVRDPADGLFKLWYTVWQGTLEEEKQGTSFARTAFATSRDGLTWDKPVFNTQEQTSIVTFSPPLAWAGGASVIIDSTERNPKRRFKMLVLGQPDGTKKSLGIFAAYSADGMHWEQQPTNPVTTWGDGPPCLYWDSARRRYVAHTRWWPPNTRQISQIESEDFVHWSPKVMVVNARAHDGSSAHARLDKPYQSAFQMMAAQPYEGTYIGMLSMHHGETLKPIPKDKKCWMNKVNAQLTFSRNGLTWQRVGPEGAISAGKPYSDAEWQRLAERAVFLPYGENSKHIKDWDWGWTMSFEPPFVISDDEIRIYYLGVPATPWWNYHTDVKPGEVPAYAFGLATLRRDGFVSVEANEDGGTLTTKPLVFIGDAIEVNADANAGEIYVEALDMNGNAVKGFSQNECEPISSDSVRHVLKWNGSEDAHALQAKPIRLSFSIKNARLFSFTPRILHRHFQSNN